MNQTLPRTLRIQESREIRRILNEGRKYTGNHIILYCLPSPISDTPTRAGFLSPKRTGKAVKRNQSRRWMREAFRRHREDMMGSHQIIMMGRTSATTAGYEAVNDDFRRLCQKARLLPPRDP